MATFKKIDGVTVNEFSIASTTNPYKLVSVAGGLEVRTGAGALANIIVANLPATDNQVQVLTVPLVGDGSNPGAVSSTATLPQNSYVTEIRVVTTVAFDLGVPLLDIGTVDDPALYADNSQFNLGLANTVILQPWTAQPNATSREVVCTLTATGGNPTTGSSTVVVFYVAQPLS